MEYSNGDIPSTGGKTVSVIIPVYKVEKYIKGCLKSLTKQTFKDFEVVLVDDGSPDNSIGVAEQYLQSTKLTYKIIHEENKGLPGARNTGIRNCTGRYVCYLDSDDIYGPEHIELLHSALCKNNCEFAFTSFEITDESNRNGHSKPSRKEVVFNKKEICDSFLQRKKPIHCCAIMLDKEFLEKQQLFFNEQLRFGEDVEYLWRLLDVTHSCVYIYSKSYKYLCRKDSIMTSQNIDRLKIFISEFKTTIGSLHFNNDYKNKIISRVFFGLCHSCAKNSDYSLFQSVINETSVVEDVVHVKQLKDMRVRVLYRILCRNPHLYWKICKVA